MPLTDLQIRKAKPQSTPSCLLHWRAALGSMYGSAGEWQCSPCIGFPLPGTPWRSSLRLRRDVMVALLVAIARPSFGVLVNARKVFKHQAAAFQLARRP